MRIQPLTGMMRPVQVLLAPDNGAGNGGGGSNGNPGSGNDDVIPDDLKIDFGFDPDLLPEEERTKFNAAQAKLQALQKRLMESNGSNQAMEALQREIAQLRQQQQQGPPRKEDEPTTIADRMRAHYKKIGVADANIEGLVQMNAPIFEDMAERLVGHMGQVTQPISERAMMGELKDVFFDLQDSDPRYAIPEVAALVWEKSQGMVKKGVEVNLDVMRNLAKIAYMDAIEANPSLATGSLPPSVPTRNSNPMTPPIRQNNSRLSYPGSGSHVANPRVNNQPVDLDPDTAAALGSVKKVWDGFKNDPKKFGQQPARR